MQIAISLYWGQGYRFIEGIDLVYLGWGKTIRRNKELRLISEKIFSRLYPNLKYYLSESFDDNPFYHPGFINRSFKRNIKTQNLIRSFIQIC